MRTLIMVHGVGVLGGRGPWRRSVKRVLNPHFHCKSLKYSHYRWFGLIGVLVEPITFLCGLVSIFIAYHYGLIALRWPWVLLVILLAAGVSVLMRLLALRSFSRRFLSRPLQLRPHVLAHSMGSYLIGACLKKPTARFSRIIVAGSVLRPDYPWEQIKAENNSAFALVRNDFAENDLVPKFAAWGERAKVLPDFGISGQTGFNAPPAHTIKNPNADCNKCNGGTPAFVHNYMCKEGHSGVLRPEYTSCFWLPWLWGYPPQEFSDWLEFCLVIDSHFKSPINWAKVGFFGDRLLDHKWAWTNSQTLHNYIEILVKAHPCEKNFNEFSMAGIVREICTGVACARLAHQKLAGNFNDTSMPRIIWKIWSRFARICPAHRKQRARWKDEVLSLDPEIAMVRAVDNILS